MSPLVSAVCIAILASSAEAASGVDRVAGIDIGAEYEARVRNGIEQNRKSGATIVVVDKDGRKLPGVKASVRQTGHDFLFGCAFPAWINPLERLGADGWENWNRYFTRLFNYVTSENALKWRSLEPEEGKYRWEAPDFMVGWCKEHRIEIKGHTLVWSYPSAGVPEWITGYSPETIAGLVKKRIDMVVGKYRGDIRIWDVVNEPVHQRWYEEHWSKDYVLDSFNWAREVDPKATLVLNEFGGFMGAANRFVQMAKDLLERGAPIDALGEQAHDSPFWYSPKRIFGTLDKMASTGLRIHLTEITYPSNDAEITGQFVHGRWDEERQGQFYRYLFALAFSHPKVDAITLWAMWDGATWLDKGGMIRRDWTPKPAYFALDDLINSKWKTRFDAKSDSNGEVRFRGFHGDYEVTASLPDGRTKSAKLHVAKGAKNVLRVTIE